MLPLKCSSEYLFLWRFIFWGGYLFFHSCLLIVLSHPQQSLISVLISLLPQPLKHQSLYILVSVSSAFIFMLCLGSLVETLGSCGVNWTMSDVCLWTLLSSEAQSHTCGCHELSFLNHPQNLKLKKPKAKCILFPHPHWLVVGFFS